MLREILWIDPRLGKQQLNKMDKDLNKRFGKISKGFGKAFNNALKGSFVGIGLAMLSQLMDPLEKVNEKLKDMLGKGADINEQASRFGTDAATIFRLQQSAGQFGLSPEDLKSMMDSFANAIETGRRETEDVATGLKAEEDLSEATKMLKEFLDEKNLGKSFVNFLNSVRAQGAGPGQDLYFLESERKKAREREARGETLDPEERKRLEKEGILRTRSGAELRARTEETVLGSRQYGAARNFIDADLNQVQKSLGLNDTKKVNRNISALGAAELARTQNQNAFETRDTMRVGGFVAGRNKNNLAQALNEKEQKEANDTTKKIVTEFDALRRTAEGIDEITAGVKWFQDFATNIVGEIGQAVKSIKEAIDWMRSNFFPDIKRIFSVFTGGR